MNGPPRQHNEDKNLLSQRMDELMMQAVESGDAGPLVELVDAQIAGGASDRSRCEVLADQWYAGSLREDRLADGVHLRFAWVLIEGGWCTPHDLDVATAENLYLLGLRCGALPARFWDFLATYHQAGRYSGRSLGHIHRDDGKGRW